MTTTMKGLPKIVWEPLVRQALVEDLGRAGDITTEATVSEDALAQGRIVARKPGRIAGLHLAIETFLMLDPQIKIDVLQCDGTDVEAGACLAQIEGLARPILTAERTALNFLGHLSGVATATAVVCQLLDGLDTQVTCTRKTTPGLRAMEKYAVRMGGGSNHRFGLDDGILIKDNHIVAAGSLSKAVSRARSSIGHMVKIEVEVDTLDQLSEALTYDIDVVLLDNMTLETLGEAVRLIDNRVISEASGDVTMDNARSIAETGVDVVSMGWITHSAPSLNVSLELENS